MALGWNKDKVRRNAEEAKIFFEVARGKEPAGWENVFGRPFRVPPPAPTPAPASPPPTAPTPQSAPAMTTEEIEVALAALSLRERIAVFRQNRQQAR
jgi:hypothetical protein